MRSPSSRTVRKLSSEFPATGPAREDGARSARAEREVGLVGVRELYLAQLLSGIETVIELGGELFHLGLVGMGAIAAAGQRRQLLGRIRRSLGLLAGLGRLL